MMDGEAIQVKLQRVQGEGVPGESMVVELSLTNLDDSLFSGKGVLSFYLSADGRLDVESDQLLTSKKITINLPEASSGKNVRNFKVAVKIPVDAAPENYHLFVSLNDENGNPTGVSANRDFARIEVQHAFGNLERNDKIKNTVLTIYNSDGSYTRFKLSGPGRAEVVTLDSGEKTLMLYGTTEKSSLKITGSKNYRPQLHDINTNGGALNAIQAATTDISGDILVGGGLKSIKIGNIGVGRNSGEHRIAIGGTGSVSLTGGVFRDVTLEAAGCTLKSIKVAEWRDTASSTANSISAGKIGTVKSSGNFEVDLAAAEISSVSVTGNAALTVSTRSLKTFSVKGDFTGILAADLIRSITVGGNASDAFFLGGTTLGSSGQLQGGGSRLGASGGLVSLTIKGNADNVIIASGIDPVDGKLFSGDDRLAGEAGTGEYQVKSIKIGGTVTGDSWLLATNLPKAVSVNGETVDPLTLPFYSNKVPVIGKEEMALKLSSSVLVTGIAENITFSVNAGIGDTVRLYKMNSGSQFLIELYDDGDPSHGDAVAGDGIYSNILAVQGDTVGGKFDYRAVTGSGEIADASIGVVAKFTEEEFSAALTRTRTLYNRLTADIARGVSEAAAFATVLTVLRSDSNVDQSSIRVGNGCIIWDTVGGLPLGISISDADLSGGGNSSYSLTSQIDMDPVTVDAAQNPKYCGNAIVLAPYYWQKMVGYYDVAGDIANALAGNGFTVTNKCNGNFLVPDITIEDYKNLGRYDAVVISTAGILVDDNNTLYLNSGVSVTNANKALYDADLHNGRMRVFDTNYGEVFGLAPSFFQAYSGSFNDSIIYVNSPYSINRYLASAFLSQGASAYIGYTGVAGRAFTNDCGRIAFTHLLEGGTVGTIPIDIPIDVYSDDAAEFIYAGDKNATLPLGGVLLNDYQLWIEYKWGQDVKDLDTGTCFLNDTVGWRWYGDGTYLDWSGDDVNRGGRETVIVDLNRAFDEGGWSGATRIDLMAGWYSPAEGYGPATLSVALQNIHTGEFVNMISHAISPGSQSGAAHTSVATVDVFSQLAGDNARVSFQWLSA